MIKYWDKIKQQSDEWFELKENYPFSASNATAIKTNGAGLETLCWEALAEKYSITDNEENYTNKNIERGKRQENILLGIYELETGIETKTTGFVTNSNYEMAGASPDAYTEEATIEIKSFNKVKYLKLQREKNKTGEFSIESKYYDQMQFQMMIMEKQKAIFIVGNANNKKKPIMWQEVEADPIVQEKIKSGIVKGRKMMSEIIKDLKY